MSNEFFVKDDDEPEQTVSEKSTKTTKTKSKEKVPSGYVAVKLSSVGKLSAPAKLHVRDYTGKDALDLSMASDEDALRVLIDVLQNMVHEDIDVNQLHENELEEIMMNVLVNFWTPVLQEFPFPATDEELDNLPEEKKQKLTVDINISNLSTNPLPEDFKEPIRVKSKEVDFSFILPRVGHHLVAEDYVEEKYTFEEQKFASIEKRINRNQDMDRKFDNQLKTAETEEARQAIEDQREKSKIVIDNEEIKEYRDYLRRRNTDYLVAKQAQMIVAKGGKTLKSLDEQIEAYIEVPLKLWQQLNEKLEESVNFGIDHDITVISPIDGSQTTRRFQFRPVDFIPSFQSLDSGDYDISFGDE